VACIRVNVIAIRCRIHLPHTPVYKGKKRKGRRPNTGPRLLSFVMSSSCSLLCPEKKIANFLPLYAFL
jgi:hypothetical protein